MLTLRAYMKYPNKITTKLIIDKFGYKSDTNGNFKLLRIFAIIIQAIQHLLEISKLILYGKKTYNDKETCIQHAQVEWNDLKYHISELIYLLTGKSLDFIPQSTYKRVYKRRALISHNKDYAKFIRLPINYKQKDPQSFIN